MIKFKNYEDYCRAFSGDDENMRLARTLLMIRTYQANLSKLDEEELGFIESDRLIFSDEEIFAKTADYISDIARDVEKIFRGIKENLRTNILRERISMPIYKAKEFDSLCISRLSREAGRNIREKLGGKRSCLAVRRRMSFDTGENRLLKEFAQRLADALFLKQEYLPQKYLDEDEIFLYDMLIRFQRMTEVQEIGPWQNTPPNNTLLSDKRYNVIWRSWEKLATIAEILKTDQYKIEKRLRNLAALLLIRIIGHNASIPQTPLFYRYTVSEMATLGEAEKYDDIMLKFPFSHIEALAPDKMPITLTLSENEPFVKIEYSGQVSRLGFEGLKLKFSINGEEPVTEDISADTFKFQVERIARASLLFLYDEPAPLPLKITLDNSYAYADLFYIQPKIWQNGKEYTFSGHLICEELRLNRGTYLLPNDISRAILAPSEKVIPYTVKSVVKSDRAGETKYLACLMNAFFRHIPLKTLYMAYPDSESEFQLSSLKRVCGMYYGKIMAFPRSLAAVFTFTKEENFKNFRVGDVILVTDGDVDGISITLIKTKADAKYKKDAPNMRGIVFEHHPAAVYRENQNEKDYAIQSLSENTASMDYYNPFGTWQKGGKLFTKTGKSLKLKKVINDYISNHKNIIGKGGIWVICLSKHKLTKNKGFNIVDYYERNILGGINHYQELKQKTSRPIWSDCLPDLSIKRLYGKLDLVKNATFAYDENLSMDIPIASTFTLPKGEANYRFNLLMEGSLNAPYEAALRHKNFPLKNDVECKLIMNYTYGKDNPYTLSFVPLDRNEKSFNQVNVSWERIERYSAEGERFPEFPPAPTWYEVQHFKDNKYGRIQDLSKELFKAVRSAFPNWKSSKKLRWILFCLHTIYGGGKYVKASDCPHDVRENVMNALYKLYTTYKNMDYDEKNKSFIINMLCIAGRDLPEDFTDDIIEYINDSIHYKVRPTNTIGYLLGDYSTPRNKRIFASISTISDSSLVVSMLSKAVWRNGKFIFNFPWEETQKYLKYAINNVCENRNIWERLLQLEYIMAVFRLREFGFSNINEYISLNNPIILKLRQKLESLVKDKIDVSKTRLQLNVQQNKEYAKYNIPDFLYALLVYVNDEKEGGDIIIKGVNDGD